jgi:hypothetical protein
MKATLRIIGTLGILAGVGLAVCLLLEHQATAKLVQDNQTLRQQLSQMDQVVAEHERLSNPVMQANASSFPPDHRAEALSAEEPAHELVRLRAQVQALRQEQQEIQTLRADTRQARAARQSIFYPNNANPTPGSTDATAGSASQFEILSAEYWTDRTNMDVSAELSDRVRGDSLKAIASNNLKGDPDFGKVKHLTVVYRVGGVTLTNEFQEGDLVVLPKE